MLVPSHALPRALVLARVAFWAIPSEISNENKSRDNGYRYQEFPVTMNKALSRAGAEFCGTDFSSVE